MTIAFGQLAWFVSIKWHSVTGAKKTLLNIPRPPLDLGFVQISLTSHAALFYFALGVHRDRLGALVSDRHALRACSRRRQAKRDARSVLRSQRLARQVHRVRDVVRDRRDRRRTVRAGTTVSVSGRDELNNSGYVVMMASSGGLVSFWGPVIGAVFFIVARDLLGAYTETWLLWYGMLFMAVVLFKPRVSPE